MNPTRMTIGALPASDTKLLAATSSLTATLMNSDMPRHNGVTRMHLIHEALSRARMRWPQADDLARRAEVSRSARITAMRARNRAAREAGLP